MENEAMQYEPFDFFSYNEAAIYRHLESGRAACMVLNKDLPGPALGQGVNYGYVLTNEYKGEERLVVAGGCYKQPVNRFDVPDPQVLRKCKGARDLTDGIYAKRIFKTTLKDPFCIILDHAVLGEKGLDMFKRTFETFETEHEGEPHTAIACIYYNPRYQTEGKIIAQWYEKVTTETDTTETA